MRAFTTADKIAAIKRELGMRQQVYPRRIGQGKMREDDARWEIDVFQAILADYERQRGTEEPRLI